MKIRTRILRTAQRLAAGTALAALSLAPGAIAHQVEQAVTPQTWSGVVVGTSIEVPRSASEEWGFQLNVCDQADADDEEEDLLCETVSVSREEFASVAVGDVR